MKSKTIVRWLTLLCLVIVASCQTIALSKPSTGMTPTPFPLSTVAASPMPSSIPSTVDERLIYVSRKNKWGVPFQSTDRVFSVYADGSGLEDLPLLNRALWPDRYLSISSDGRYLAFNSEGDPYGSPQSKWYLADLEIQSLLTLPIENLEYHLNSGASWSPLESEFVIALWPDYAAEQGNPRQGGGLFVLEASTLQKRRITANDSPRIVDTLPAWSPTGAVIAFLRCTKAPSGTSVPQNECALYSVHPDGSELRLLASQVYVKAAKKKDYASLYDSMYNAPAWSHDGQWLAYVSDKGNAEIGLFDITTGKAHLLASSPFEDIHPTWSPSIDQIAFTTQRDGNDEIYVSAVNGTRLANLTQNPASDIMPVWSPSGNHIAFLSDRASDEAGHYQLYVMNADGSDQTRIGDEYAFTQFAWSLD